jgi:hypothetical protein
VLAEESREEEGVVPVEESGDAVRGAEPARKKWDPLIKQCRFSEYDIPSMQQATKGASGSVVPLAFPMAHPPFYVALLPSSSRSMAWHCIQESVFAACFC